jgi:hypothetical protein
MPSEATAVGMAVLAAVSSDRYLLEKGSTKGALPELKT